MDGGVLVAGDVVAGIKGEDAGAWRLRVYWDRVDRYGGEYFGFAGGYVAGKSFPAAVLTKWPAVGMVVDGTEEKMSGRESDRCAVLPLFGSVSRSGAQN
ncbi:hypothetical protein Tco_0659975 [Tanacetum coccineum]|uniref:Uncharacterized protein n=1 Tax=Tanacetum coccineum TaxID=301880 RepID=A0ABQ5GJ96_9ASTR